jgi:tungstate transport system ATP-binding protein
MRTDDAEQVPPPGGPSSVEGAPAAPAAAVSRAGQPASVAIEARGLLKRYGERTVVSVESLQVYEQEVLAILGPNGAGKTTLFRLLALLEQPDAGSVLYHGKKVDIHDLASRRRTAAVFQRPLLFQGSVEDNIRFGLRFRRLPRAEVATKIQRTLELMGITHLAAADMRTLSGGEMQRVALARALALEPEILFLDEPTSNLDVHVRRRFREDLRRVVDSLAATVVIITHEHSEALALAQRVAVIQDGAVVQIGTPEEVFTHPQNAFVADFTGAETIWHGEAVACEQGLCTVRTQAGILVQAVGDFAEGQTVVLAIRPEDVALAPPVDEQQPGRTSVRNQWCGVVDSVTPAGPLVRVVVRLDCTAGTNAVFGGEGEVISLITRASAGELELAPKKRVSASVKATALHVLAG